MKKIIIALLAVLFCICTAEAKYQKGYYKPSSGKYISGHYKTNSNRTKLDNYSTKGNRNPFTGKKGYKDPYKTKSFKY
ncbi:MAG: hypothetical protein IJ479_02400 [Alphaproteobacteria bacterium]|nr:hypothetical protein [Alphaproteobacteria bacterium]